MVFSFTKTASVSGGYWKTKWKVFLDNSKLQNRLSDNFSRHDSALSDTKDAHMLIFKTTRINADDVYIRKR
jgi:hypothetical protein